MNNNLYIFLGILIVVVLVLLMRDRGFKKEIKKLKEPKKIDYDTYLSILKLHTKHRDYMFNSHGFSHEFDLDFDTVYAIIGRFMDLGWIEKITTIQIECESCGHIHYFENQTEVFNTDNCKSCRSPLSKTDLEDNTYTKYKITQKGLSQKPTL